MDLFDIHQQMSIRGNRHSMAAMEAEQQVQRKQDQRRADDLEDRFERLLLLTEAMWSLLTEHYGLTDAHLLHKMTELDGLDGTIEGRRQRPKIECGDCGAAISREFARCLYCGSDAEVANAFDRF